MEQNTTNKPLRRVGTLTLGVCLIAAGVLFLLARFLPGLPWLVIWQVLPAAGLILLGWGIVQVGLSLQSHDPSQRSQGFLTLAGGLVITFAKEILDLITA